MPTPSSSDGPPEGVFASPIHPFLLIVSKPMRQSGALAADERIVDVMIQLARAAKTQRAIAAGDSSFELLVELHRRGFLRATTTRTVAFHVANSIWLWWLAGAIPSRSSKRPSIGWRRS